MAENTGCLLVLTTCQTNDTAEKIARHLVDNKIAACINVIPNITSYFNWKDEAITENELLLLIKTSVDRFPTVKQKIITLHPYELPEIIAVPIQDGLKDYLHWIKESTS